MTTCTQCNTDNRSAAKYCKRCGTTLPAAPVDQLLGRLIGLQEVRDVLEELQATTEGMRQNQQTLRVDFSTLILGNSGTAKSLLGGLMASVLHKLGLTQRPDAKTIDALQLDAVTTKTLEADFKAATDGVLFIDNGHKWLTPEGDPLPIFTQLIRLMDGSPANPVVVFAGLPFGLQEFLGKPEHKNLVGRFKNIFRIEDYLPAQLLEIAAHHLTAQGFVLPPETRLQLELRLRWLHRQIKSGDASIQTQNGRLALTEAESVAREYYKRRATDRVLLPADVKGAFEKRKTIEEILTELDAFVGMPGIKREVRALYEDVRHARMLAERGLVSGERKFGFHFTITGNPGTGKTTVARSLGEIFEALGVLPSGHVVEVDRSKLVAEFQGQTSPRVQAACNQAMAGVLFIDEAYALKSSDNDNFGQEAIDTLLKRMEDDKGKFVVIAAGYTREIDDFLKTNPGLQSRFTKHFKLEDYTPDELAAIFEGMARKQGYNLDAGGRDRVVAFFKDRCARKTKDFANGREARNLLDTVMRAQGDRARKLDASATTQELMGITAADIPVVGAQGSADLDAAMKQLNQLVGLKRVKDAVARLHASLDAQKLMGENEVLSRHFVFTGNPGTGKTTVARIVADIFYGLGLLPTNRLIEVDRSKMVGAYVGHTAKAVDKICDDALGGVLFIDEAYTLAPTGGQHDFGKEAIDTLLKRMEDDRGKFVVIAAGYTGEMQSFLDSNSGLRSRFSDLIEFDDYTAPEMATIFDSLARGRQFDYGDGFEAAMHDSFSRIFASRDKSFANGRTVRQLFDKVRESCASRVTALQVDDDTKKIELRTLRIEDLQTAKGG